MSKNVEYVVEVAKAAPPVSVAGLSVAGITLSDFVLILTAIYTVAQLIVLAPKFVSVVKGFINERRN